jgi:putative membrane protein
MRAIAFLVTSLCLWPGAALAHGAETYGDGSRWTFDLWIVAPLLLTGLLYAGGTLILQRRVHHRSPLGWQGIAFWCGWLSLSAALISPLHWLGERLFTFHMIEHEIIMAISAPLIAVAKPVGPLLWSLPRRARVRTGRAMRLAAVRTAWTWLSAGTNATIIHGIAIWAWHAPPLFDAAVTDAAVHRLQHLSFFATALLFWWSVLWRSETGAAAWHVFVTMLHTSVLGALMALAPRVLYDAQTATAAAWGLTPLEDQELAGIIMWVPAGTVYAGAALALLAIWIKRSSGKAQDEAVGAI